MRLPPHKLITTPKAWQTCIEDLSQENQIAIDLEANSMFAYQEQVCLIQLSTPFQDYIVDPLKPLDLSPLGKIITNPAVEKIFHAAEYDLILMKGEFGWEAQNVFDTMWAARILGYKRYGLANLLRDLFDVKLNKRFQKSNWCKRPLSDAQLTYAQHDTHHLFDLRNHLAVELEAQNRVQEAQEIFREQIQVEAHNHEFDPDDFWGISGARYLSRQQQAVLKAINTFRNQEAARRDLPLFKVFGDKTLLQIAKAMPNDEHALGRIHGMSRRQTRRYGSRLLQIIEEAKEAPAPERPRRSNHYRQSDPIILRYEKLHYWRKTKARKRGVESDVIVSRDALWRIAKENPQSAADLAQMNVLGEWRLQTYSDDILRVLDQVE